MSLLYITLFVFIIAFIDYEHLSVNQYIRNHYSRVALRLLYCYVASHSLFEFSAMAIFIGATFDNTLNLMRFGKKGIWRLGTTADWDRFWRERMTLYKIFVITSLIVSIYMLLTIK